MTSAEALPNGEPARPSDRRYGVVCAAEVGAPVVGASVDGASVEGVAPVEDGTAVVLGAAVVEAPAVEALSLLHAASGSRSAARTVVGTRRRIASPFVRARPVARRG